MSCLLRCTWQTTRNCKNLTLDDIAAAGKTWRCHQCYQRNAKCMKLGRWRKKTTQQKAKQTPASAKFNCPSKLNHAQKKFQSSGQFHILRQAVDACVSFNRRCGFLLLGFFSCFVRFFQPSCCDGHHWAFDQTPKYQWKTKCTYHISNHAIK